MNKIVKGLKALGLLIKKPYLANLIIETPQEYKKKVIAKYGMPNGLKQLDLGVLFPNFSESLSTYAFLDGSSLPIDLAVLKSLARTYEVQDYLEIGTWRGESVANIAEVVPNCFTLNLPDEVLLANGAQKDYVNSHRFFSKELSNVKHLFGHSHDFDFNTLNTKFDMIFIDGDHHYEAVKKDTERMLDLLKTNNSIIVWHDYALSPETIRWDVMLGILDGLPKEKYDKLYHISNTLCAVYINEDFPSHALRPYALPNKKFHIDLSYKKL